MSKGKVIVPKDTIIAPKSKIIDKPKYIEYFEPLEEDAPPQEVMEELLGHLIAAALIIIATFKIMAGTF